MLRGDGVLDAKRNPGRERFAERLSVGGVWLEQRLEKLAVHAVDNVFSPVGMIQADKSAKEPAHGVRKVSHQRIPNLRIGERSEVLNCGHDRFEPECRKQALADGLAPALKIGRFWRLLRARGLIHRSWPSRSHLLGESGATRKKVEVQVVEV